jgi:hypothetical protein
MAILYEARQIGDFEPLAGSQPAHKKQAIPDGWRLFMRTGKANSP